MKYRIGDKVILKDSGYSFDGEIATVYALPSSETPCYQVILLHVTGETKWLVYENDIIPCTIGKQLLFSFME